MTNDFCPARRAFCAPLAAMVWWPLAARAQAPAPGRLRVVASFSILADMVREIGGDAVEVVSLVPANADAHVFQPSPLHARQLAQAQLVAANGLGFEGWMDRLVRAAGYAGPVVVASKGVALRMMGRGLDPHAWQDLARARTYVDNLADAMGRAMPAAAEGFARRAAAYRQRLHALDQQTRALFATMPATQRRVITSHDAFGYFGAAYGIEFLSAQGPGTEGEASAATVARLIEQVRREGVRAVFVENISDPRLIERIAHEAGATLGGRLYSDALSAVGGEADTYLKLFAHNASTLAAGMAGRPLATMGAPVPAGRPPLRFQEPEHG